jgi:hypothetical protein
LPPDVQINVSLVANPQVPEGYNALGNVSDKVFAMSGTPAVPDSRARFKFNQEPPYGRLRNQQDYPWGEKGKIHATRMQYGFGDHSVEKYAASLRRNKQGWGIPTFANPKVGLEFVQDKTFANIEEVPINEGRPIAPIPAGQLTGISSEQIRKVRASIGEVDGGLSGSANPKFTIDALKYAVVLTPADSADIVGGLRSEGIDITNESLLDVLMVETLENNYSLEFTNFQVDWNNNGEYHHARRIPWFFPDEAKKFFRNVMGTDYVPKSPGR